LKKNRIGQLENRSFNKRLEEELHRKEQGISQQELEQRRRKLKKKRRKALKRKEKRRKKRIINN
jgi:hypothetical protein